MFLQFHYFDFVSFNSDIVTTLLLARLGLVSHKFVSACVSMDLLNLNFEFAPYKYKEKILEYLVFYANSPFFYGRNRLL